MDDNNTQQIEDISEYLRLDSRRYDTKTEE